MKRPPALMFPTRLPTGEIAFNYQREVNFKGSCIIVRQTLSSRELAIEFDKIARGFQQMSDKELSEAQARFSRPAGEVTAIRMTEHDLYAFGFLIQLAISSRES